MLLMPQNQTYSKAMLIGKTTQAMAEGSRSGAIKIQEEASQSTRKAMLYSRSGNAQSKDTSS